MLPYFFQAAKIDNFLMQQIFFAKFRNFFFQVRLLEKLRFYLFLSIIERLSISTQRNTIKMHDLL